MTRRVWLGVALATSVAVGTAGAVVAVSDGAEHAKPRGPAPTTTSSSTTTSSTTTTTTTTLPPPTPVRIGGGGVYGRVATENRVIFVTIDDGQYRDPAVLDFVRDHQIPVTLFPTSTWASRDPAYFQSFRDLGASVQNHTVTHPDLRRFDQAGQEHEICGAAGAVERLFGERPWMLRPPGAFFDDNTRLAARGCGMRAIVLWRATMNDGVLAVQGGGTLQPGDIVLMHFRPDLVQNLQVLLQAAADAGLSIAPLEDYFTPG